MGDVVSAVASPITSLVGQPLQNDWQSNENRKSREWQEYMARLSAQIEHDYWVQQQQISEASQLRIWNQTQSPTAQAHEYMKAGINPAAAMAHGMSGAVPAAASPAGVHPVVGDGSAHPATSVAGGQLSGIASIINAVGSFTSNKAQAYKIYEMLDSEIGRNLSDARYKDLLSDYQTVANSIYKIFGHTEKSAEILNTYNNALLLAAKGNTEAAKAVMLDMQGKLFDKQGQKIDKELPFVAQAMQATINNLDSQTELNEAKKLTEPSVRAANYAAAEEHHASAGAINYDTSFKKAIESGRLAMFADDLYKSFNSTIVSDADKERAIAAAKAASVAADHAEANFWKDYILDILGGTTEAIGRGAGAYRDLKFSKAFTSLSKEQQRKVAAQVDNLELQYGDTYIERRDKDAKVTSTEAIYRRKKKKFDIP